MKKGATKLALADRVSARRDELARALVDRQYANQPDLAERWGDHGRAHCLSDALYTLDYLASALSTDSPSLFADYLEWLKTLLAGHGIASSDIEANLDALDHVLAQHLPATELPPLRSLIHQGRLGFGREPAATPAHAPSDSLAGHYVDALLTGRRQTAYRLVQDAVAAGLSVREAYLKVFQPAQQEIGRLWQLNRITVAQEHLCTAATQLLIAQLYPLVLAEHEKKAHGRTLVAACVGGELHEMGLRMVADFFEMEGWQTTYLGANTPSLSMIATLRQIKPDLFALSATMPYHLVKARDLIAQIRDTPELAKMQILAGGLPFTRDPDLHRRLRADATALDAQGAIAVGLRLCKAA